MKIPVQNNQFCVLTNLLIGLFQYSKVRRYMSWKRALITSRFWHLPDFIRGVFFHRYNNERYCSAFCTRFFALVRHMPCDRLRYFYDTAIFFFFFFPICFNLYNTSTDRKLNFTCCILLFFEISMLLRF